MKHGWNKVIAVIGVFTCELIFDRGRHSRLVCMWICLYHLHPALLSVDHCLCEPLIWNDEIWSRSRLCTVKTVRGEMFHWMLCYFEKHQSLISMCLLRIIFWSEDGNTPTLLYIHTVLILCMWCLVTLYFVTLSPCVKWWRQMLCNHNLIWLYCHLLPVWVGVGGDDKFFQLHYSFFKLFLTLVYVLFINAK